MRWQNAETAAEYVDRHAGGLPSAVERTSAQSGEQFFLGLRLDEGMEADWSRVRAGGGTVRAERAAGAQRQPAATDAPRSHALERSFRGIRMTEALSLIDLRSDTVTKPTPAMRRAMAEAEVGDDVYGEDPTVNRLEQRAAEILRQSRPLCLCPPARWATPSASRSTPITARKCCAIDRAHILDWELCVTAWFSGCLIRAIPTRGRNSALARHRARDPRLGRRIDSPTAADQSGAHAQHGRGHTVSAGGDRRHLRPRA